MRALLTASLVLGLATAAMAQTADLKVGDQAPNFKLQATDGKTYQLSDFKGKRPVVVAWFPAAFTRGCTIECKSLADNGDKIKMYDVLNERGVASRWTFYIDKNGKISYIEKMVKPETSAEDMISKLAELKVPMTHGTK